ncbi:hypothetical protein D3C77_530590 [compost metagenome]
MIQQTDNPALRYIIAFNLYKHGFSELALDIIIESNSNQENEKIYTLVRNILRDAGQVDDAIYYADQAYKLNKNFSNAYELLMLLLKNQMIEEAELVLGQMKSMEPQSPWAHTFSINKFMIKN